MSTRAVLLFLALVASGALAQTLEALPSTANARHFRLSEDGLRPARFDVDLPKTQAPAAGFPTVVVVPGLACQAEDYTLLRRRLVQAGYAAATFEWEDNEDLDADDWDEHLAALTELLLAEARDAQSALGGAIDAGRLGIVGHSLGGSVAVLAAARDRRFKALVVCGPGGKQTEFLDRASELRLPTLGIDGSLDRVAPPDEASGVVLERAQTRYTAHVIVKDGNHPNAPADFDTDYIRDSGRFVMKPIPFWPFFTTSYEFPIVEGIRPIPSRTQRAIAFPYLIGWFDRFVARSPDALDLVARGAKELAEGKLTVARFSPALEGGAGLAGSLGQ